MWLLNSDFPLTHDVIYIHVNMLWNEVWRETNTIACKAHQNFNNERVVHDLWLNHKNIS